MEQSGSWWASLFARRTEKILFMNVLKEYKVSLKNCLEKPSMDTLPPHPKSSFKFLLGMVAHT